MAHIKSVLKVTSEKERCLWDTSVLPKCLLCVEGTRKRIQILQAAGLHHLPTVLYFRESNHRADARILQPLSHSQGSGPYSPGSVRGPPEENGELFCISPPLQRLPHRAVHTRPQIPSALSLRQAPCRSAPQAPAQPRSAPPGGPGVFPLRQGPGAGRRGRGGEPGGGAAGPDPAPSPGAPDPPMHPEAGASTQTPALPGRLTLSDPRSGADTAGPRSPRS